MSKLLMVRPCCFGFNPQTAVNNAFQVPSGEDPALVREKALLEFDHFVALLHKHNVDVIVVQDTPEPHTPDSIFPNNWISFHPGKMAILYPMYAPNRRLERKKTVFQAIQEHAPRIRWIDMSPRERENRFLEGTGSMVFDRENKRAYACRSQRTDEELLRQVCDTLDYEPVCFDALDKGAPIYHTNVMMCMARQYVVICLESVPSMADRQKLLETFEKDKKTVVEITAAQMNEFAGNMFQVFSRDNEPFLVMSHRAHKSLTKSQLKVLRSFNKMITPELDTIEIHGGGSARCMIAEVV
ncbi:MAG TPA: arginine deiminase-related protein [Bacteroidales bacterium]|nr:arginine deiminase-related protein [Bacteroidales bacterium]HQB55356.1 arginine deiminase-related protein [Bacteroidales bacterium]